MAEQAIRSAAPPRRAPRSRSRSRDPAERTGRIWTEAYGIGLLATAAILLLCLVSYHPADVESTGLANMTGRTHNLIGPVGAHLADLALWLFGSASFLLSACLAGFGAAFLFSRRVRVSGRSVGGGLLLLLTVSALAHLLAGRRTVLFHAAGGLLGELSGEVLRSLFSTVGTYVLSGAALAVAVVLLVDLSLGALLRRIGQGVRAVFVALGRRIRDAWTRWRQERQERREQLARLREALHEAREVEETSEQWTFGDEVSLPDPDSAAVRWSFADEEGPVPPPDETGPEEEARRAVAAVEEVLPPEPAEIDLGLVIHERTSTPLPERPVQAHLDLGDPGDFTPPAVSLLDYEDGGRVPVDRASLNVQAARLLEVLGHYGIQGAVGEVHPGPVVTMFEFKPKAGTRLNRITSIASELAMELKARAVRIVAPIPGRDVVGIEVPSERRETVWLKEVIAQRVFADTKKRLPLALGKDIFGQPVVADLAKMPHLLVAGTTGSGKSVAVNAMIVSLLYRYGPKDLRLILVDPKQLEFNVYDGIPHLLHPVVTDPKLAAGALRWAVDEMERRYARMAQAGVRDLLDYNRRCAGSPPEDDPEGELLPRLPYLVVILDEFADLMLVASKDVEHAVCRLAQKARAAGIHLVLATQRPSTDVITGVIKANFPGRVGMTVQSSTDSRVILGGSGCEHLLNKGDMLVMTPGSSSLQRVHGPFVTDVEIRRVVEHLKEQQEVDYDLELLAGAEEAGAEGGDDGSAERDEVWDHAVALVADKRVASASMLQRFLRVGYNRAARLIEEMERDGIVGPPDGARPRQVLVPPPP